MANARGVSAQSGYQTYRKRSIQPPRRAAIMAWHTTLAGRKIRCKASAKTSSAAMKQIRPSDVSQGSFSCQAMMTATHIKGSAGRLNQRVFCRSNLSAEADQPKCDSASP